LNKEIAMAEQVIFFRRYPFIAGQKLHIEDGPRRGDWLVAEVSEKKVTLRCPVSGTVVEWDRFCYFVEEREAQWPAAE
jgi:hypothetical protein